MCTFVCIFMACMVSIWLHIRTAVVHLAHLCTMTWSVDNVIAEIKDVGQLLHFKRQNGASNMDHLEATLIKNITCKLETMFLSPTQALSVQKALHEDVNLTPDMKASVNASIDASLTRDSNNNESAHGPKPQKINVSPYLTMSDWDIIKNSQRPINRIPTSFAITTRLTIKHEASKGLIIHICFPSLPIPQCQPYQWLHYFAWKSGLKNLMPGS